MPLSAALKRVYATAPDDAYYIETLQLSHPNFPTGDRYLTNEKDGWQGRDEGAVLRTFEFVPFSAVPPRAEEQNNTVMQVQIDNASRYLMENLEAIATAPTNPIVVTYRVYLNTDPDTIQNDPALVLDVLTVVATQQVISFAASLDNLRTKPFPSFLYDTNYYPGLAR